MEAKRCKKAWDADGFIQGVAFDKQEWSVTLLKFNMEPEKDGFPKKNLLFQGLISRLHVKLQGVCICSDLIYFIARFGNILWISRRKKSTFNFPYHPWDWYIYLHLVDFLR